MFNSVRSHGLQPTRFLCPWDSPGKNTGVGFMAFSRGSSQSRDRTCVSNAALADGFFTTSTTREALTVRVTCTDPPKSKVISDKGRV